METNETTQCATPRRTSIVGGIGSGIIDTNTPLQQHQHHASPLRLSLPSPNYIASSPSHTPGKMFLPPLSAIPEFTKNVSASSLTEEEMKSQPGDIASTVIQVDQPIQSAQHHTPMTPSRSGMIAAASTPSMVGRSATIHESLMRTPNQPTNMSQFMSGSQSARNNATAPPSAPNSAQTMKYRDAPGQVQQSRSAASSPANHHLGIPNLSNRRRPSLSLLSNEVELSIQNSDPHAPTHSLEPPGMRPDAMISYSRRDLTFVKHLAAFFDHAGRNVWVDWKCIPKAVDFMESIRSGIRESNSFLYIISPDSIASKYCDAELDYALQYGKRIIPIVIREVLPNKVRQEIQQLNWIFCMAPTPAATMGNGTPITAAPVSASPSVALHDVFPHILESVLVDPAYVLMHTKLLIRAIEWEHNGQEISFLASGRELEEANKWMKKSQIYAQQQQQRPSAGNQLLRRTSAMGSGMLAPPAPPPAPLPTRIQKLFVFASNERVADSRRKERLLAKFLEVHDAEEIDQDHDATGEDSEPEDREPSDELHPLDPRDQPAAADTSALADPSDANPPARRNHASISLAQREHLRGSASAVHQSGVQLVTSSQPSQPSSPEHGSLAPSSANGKSAPNGLAIHSTKVHSFPVANASQSQSAIAKLTKSSTKSSHKSAALRRRSASSNLHSSGTLHLPHLSSTTSDYSRWSRSRSEWNGGMRSVLAGQAELLAQFGEVVREKERKEKMEKDQSLQHQQQHQGDAAEAYKIEEAQPSVESSPPPPSMPGPSTFSQVRFAAFTLTESYAWTLFFRLLILVDGALVLLLLIISLGGFSSSSNLGIESFDSTARDVIYPVRIMLEISVAVWLAEALILVCIVHSFLTHLRSVLQHHRSLLCTLSLLIAIAILDGLGWNCRGVQDQDSLQQVDTGFTDARCHGNMLVWTLILRSWFLLVKWSILRERSFAHALHSFHISLVASKATISKLKKMLVILNGEIMQTEHANQNKWQQLKNFHPSRRFSKANIDTGFNGGAAGALAGASGGSIIVANPVGGVNPLAPPSAAELSHAATFPTPFRAAAAARLAAKTARTLPIQSPARRRQTMMPIGGTRTSPRSLVGGAGAEKRYSTISPGQTFAGGSMYTPSKRVSTRNIHLAQHTTPTGTPRLAVNATPTSTPRLAYGEPGISSQAMTRIDAPSPSGSPDIGPLSDRNDGLPDNAVDNSLSEPTSLATSPNATSSLHPTTDLNAAAHTHKAALSPMRVASDSAHSHQPTRSSSDLSDSSAVSTSSVPVRVHLRSESGTVESLLHRLDEDDPLVNEGLDESSQDEEGEDDKSEESNPTDSPSPSDEETIDEGIIDDALTIDMVSPAIQRSSNPRGSILVGAATSAMALIPPHAHQQTL